MQWSLLKILKEQYNKHHESMTGCSPETSVDKDLTNLINSSEWSVWCLGASDWSYLNSCRLIYETLSIGCKHLLWISQVNAVGSLWTCFLLHAFYFNGLHPTVSQSIRICFDHVLADVVSSSHANTASNQTINMLSEHDMTFIAEMLIWHVRHVQMYVCCKCVAEMYRANKSSQSSQ